MLSLIISAGASGANYPAQKIQGTCFNGGAAFTPARTTVRVSHYDTVDRGFSPQLSTRYWRNGGSTTSYPNVYAAGFGGTNAVIGV